MPPMRSDMNTTIYLAGRSRFLRTSAGGKLTLVERGRQAATFLGVCREICNKRQTLVRSMSRWDMHVQQEGTHHVSGR